VTRWLERRDGVGPRSRGGWKGAGQREVKGHCRLMVHQVLGYVGGNLGYRRLLDGRSCSSSDIFSLHVTVEENVFLYNFVIIIIGW
jgi:hypothetical protein